MIIAHVVIGQPINKTMRTKLVEYEFDGIKYLRKVDKDGRVFQEGIEPDGWKPIERGRSYPSTPLFPASQDQLRMIRDFIFDGLEIDPFKCIFRLNNRNDRKPREVPFNELTTGDAWDILNIHKKHNLEGLKKLII